MSEVDAIIQRLGRRVDARLDASRTVLEAWGEDAKDYMQQNAPWQDESGEAWRKLGWVRQHPQRLRDGARIALIHGSKHGKVLELSDGSRLAILQPTAAVKGPELVIRLKEVWE